MIHKIAVIGGGFSGSMFVVNLINKLKENNSENKVTIDIYEKNKHPNLGIAYSTRDANHLLNVPAIKMSAFEEDDEHFFQWVKNNFTQIKLEEKYKDLVLDPYEFYPRSLYGKYLQNIYNNTTKNFSNISLINKEINEINHNGSSFIIDNKNYDVVVLAVGNNVCTTTKQNDENQFPKNVTIIGTGLTMIDHAISIKNCYPDTKITAISRHGLLPKIHGNYIKNPYNLSNKSFPSTLLELIIFFKQELKQHNITAEILVDALRPYTNQIFASLSEKDRKKFRSRLSYLWSVYRHRIAPQIGQKINEMLESRQLSIIKGNVISIDKISDDKSEVKLKNGQIIDTSKVIFATGNNYNINDVMLLKNLEEQKLITKSNSAIGIRVNSEYQTHSDNNIFAIGSILSGEIFESIAVPDLKIQANRLAEIICKKII